MVNIQLLRVQNVVYKILQIFSRVFEFALAEFCAKFTKINAPRIFPLLQYIIVVMWNRSWCYFLSGLFDHCPSFQEVSFSKAGNAIWGAGKSSLIHHRQIQTHTNIHMCVNAFLKVVWHMCRHSCALFHGSGHQCQILDFDWVWNTIATVVDIEWHEMRPWSLCNSSAGGLSHRRIL